MAMFSLFVWLFVLRVQQIAASDLIVDLGYAKYQGINQGNGVNRWAGMRYARSVSRIDGMRFVAPQDPLPMRGIMNASEFGPICIGSTTNLEYEFGDSWSEDCLFANVFAPETATANSSLPVYIFIQGGGFNVNGNANYDGDDLIHAANSSIIIVNFNYRVGPYGFLASKEIVEDKNLSLNNGLKDQRQLLKWVKKYIHKFGGDPNHVTLGGASAGAASVVLQLTAYGGRDDKLFHAAAAESQAFPPIRNVTDMQWTYDDILKRTGCQNLTCMQEMNAVEFQNAVRNFKAPFPGAKGAPIFFWNPTLDDDFVKDYTYNEINAGHFVKVPTIFGDTTNEGWTFTRKNIDSLSEVEQFITDQFPNLNNTDYARIRKVWHGPVGLHSDSQWRNIASDIYSHIRYICPGLTISHAYAENSTVPTWQYRWNVGHAYHVEELPSIWHGGPTAASVLVQNYMASFIRFFDPNKSGADSFLASGKNVSSPTWEPFGDGMGERLLFSNDNKVQMESVSLVQYDRCSIITSLGIQLAQPSAGNRITSRWTPAHLACFLSVLCILQWLCT